MVKFTITSTLRESEDTTGNTQKYAETPQAKTPSPAAVRFSLTQAILS